MASEDDSETHQSEYRSVEKIDNILTSLGGLHKLVSPLKEDDSIERRAKGGGITDRNYQKDDTLARSQSAPPFLTHIGLDSKMIVKLQYLFQLLRLNLGKLEQFQTNVRVQLERNSDILESLIECLDSSRVSSHRTYLVKPDLEVIEKKISDLLYQLPVLSGKQEKQKITAYGVQDDEDEDHQYKAYSYLPGIHSNVVDLINCGVFRYVKYKFMELDMERKICLLSFAVFPENREVHRTVLMYWWIGEGILPVKGAEEAVRAILKEFTEAKLVEPVEERRKVAPSSYKMNPFVHASVVLLSKQIGVFDIYGEGCKPSMHMSDKGKMFIVEESEIQREATAKDVPSKDIETVFNVSERYLDSTIKWLSKKPRTHRRFTMNSSEAWFKSLKVFYLGRWERTKKRHIEVQNHELMKILKHVTKVKVLSFQGISTIRSLSSLLCKLHQLIVLDLRECYELTKLPEKIDSLKNLVYLDMTGCYMLEWIPMRLAWLENLEVLKGFVVSDSQYENVACKLIYLKRLRKLRKLSIEINRDDFGVNQLMEDLAMLKALTSLKVTWMRDLEFSRPTTELVRTITRMRPDRVVVPDEVGVQLKKLNLQRFPEKELPEWFYPEKLPHLKKLYIGGGKKLKGFGKFLPEEPTKCGVEVLRLTSLPKLRVGWIELKQIYFPKLTFLEKYECPRVTLTPCDGNGIWRADQD